MTTAVGSSSTVGEEPSDEAPSDEARTLSRIPPLLSVVAGMVEVTGRSDVGWAVHGPCHRQHRGNRCASGARWLIDRVPGSGRPDLHCGTARRMADRQGVREAWSAPATAPVRPVCASGWRHAGYQHERGHAERSEPHANEPRGDSGDVSHGVSVRHHASCGARGSVHRCDDGQYNELRTVVAGHDPSRDAAPAIGC
jgi:hypothetical protein